MVRSTSQIIHYTIIYNEKGEIVDLKIGEKIKLNDKEKANLIALAHLQYPLLKNHWEEIINESVAEAEEDFDNLAKSKWFGKEKKLVLDGISFNKSEYLRYVKQNERKRLLSKIELNGTYVINSVSYPENSKDGRKVMENLNNLNRPIVTHDNKGNITSISKPLKVTTIKHELPSKVSSRSNSDKKKFGEYGLLGK